MGSHYLSSQVAMELEARMYARRGQDEALDRSIFRRGLALLLLVGAHELHKTWLKHPEAGPIAFAIAEKPKRSIESRLSLLVKRDGQWQPIQPEPDTLRYMNDELGAASLSLAIRDWALGAAFQPEQAQMPGQLLFRCDPAHLAQQLAQILDPITLASWQSGQLCELLDGQTAQAVGRTTVPRL